MKEIKIGDLLAAKARSNRLRDAGIIVPQGVQTSRNWPLCQTCLHEVDAAEIKDVSTTGCELWCRCHNQEDFVKVTWKYAPATVGVDPREDANIGWAINRAVQDWLPFVIENHHDFSSKR